MTASDRDQAADRVVSVLRHPRRENTLSDMGLFNIDAAVRSLHERQLWRFAAAVEVPVGMIRPQHQRKDIICEDPE